MTSDDHMIDHHLLELLEQQIVEQSRRISFYIAEYTVELLVLKMDREEFHIPDYQREFTWEAYRKSRFIESLLMGLPIPFLFFWSNPQTGILEIVDGSQRLRTIQEFLHGELTIGPLDQLSLLDGLTFFDLPESRQRKIKNISIRGILLSEHTDEQSRFDIFERINTGSKIADPQEVRRGALGGPFLQLVIELGQSQLFQELAPVSEERAKKRERDELVTRFFAYGDGLDEYKDRVGDFLYDYTKRMNTLFAADPSRVQVYRNAFLETMEFVKNNFAWGFRRVEDGTFTPRTRFEAIAIGSLEAIRANARVIERRFDTERWLQTDEFARVTTSDGGNAKRRVIERIEFVRDRLLEELP